MSPLYFSFLMIPITPWVCQLTSPFFVLISKFNQALCNGSRSIPLYIHVINKSDNICFVLIMLSVRWGKALSLYPRIVLKKRNCAYWKLNRKSLLLWELTMITARPATGICIICTVDGIRERNRWNIKGDYYLYKIKKNVNWLLYCQFHILLFAFCRN